MASVTIMASVTYGKCILIASVTYGKGIIFMASVVMAKVLWQMKLNRAMDLSKAFGLVSRNKLFPELKKNMSSSHTMSDLYLLKHVL